MLAHKDNLSHELHSGLNNVRKIEALNLTQKEMTIFNHHEHNTHYTLFSYCLYFIYDGSLEIIRTGPDNRWLIS